MLMRTQVLGAAAREDSSRKTNNHEVQGTTEVVNDHCHRFAGVTGGEIASERGRHRHELVARTDFVAGHFHRIDIKTGENINVQAETHIHYTKAYTTEDMGHRHAIEFCTFASRSKQERNDHS